MIPGFRGSIRQRFDRALILVQQPRTLGVDPRLELTAITEMESVEKGSPIESSRRGPLARADGVIEGPHVRMNELRIQRELMPRRDNDFAPECSADRIDRLIERVAGARRIALRPEVRLDAMPGHALPPTEREHRQQAQAPLLSGG